MTRLKEALKSSWQTTSAAMTPMCALPQDTTQSSRHQSYALGIRAGQYVPQGTTDDYRAVKTDIRDAIREGSFHCVAFNEGYVAMTHRDYDYDEQQGDMFEIGREMNDKVFRDALAHTPPRSGTFFNAALRLIR